MYDDVKVCVSCRIQSGGFCSQLFPYGNGKEYSIGWHSHNQPTKKKILRIIKYSGFLYSMVKTNIGHVISMVVVEQHFENRSRRDEEEGGDVGRWNQTRIRR